MASGQINGLCLKPYVCCGSSCCIPSLCETCVSGNCVGCAATSVCCSGTCQACKSTTFVNSSGSYTGYRYKPCNSSQCGSNISGTLGPGASIVLCIVSGSGAWNTTPSPGSITEGAGCAPS